MKEKISRKEVEQKIKDFFEKEKIEVADVKKIKKLAMKFGIKIGENRRKFCEKCYSDLKNGKVGINKNFKSVECLNCGFKNRWKIGN